MTSRTHAGTEGKGTRMHERAAVFVGPGLTERDFAGIDRDALDVRRPIRRGDLARAVESGYRTIAIIDGEFYHTLTVSPKEILVALRGGVRILGGSSMGALRAAEMDVYGMQGVGRIYSWYHDGTVTRDDDVALMFGEIDEYSYRCTTVAMVNVMWAVREFKRLGLLPAAERRKLSNAARRIHWTARCWPEICARAGLGERDTAMVRQWAGEPENDLKRLDAKLVIERTTALLHDGAEAPTAHHATKPEVVAP